MHAFELDEEYLTIAEAAALLKVAPSTIRRWIREGDLPASRIGRRRIALKRGDVASLITPVHSDAGHFSPLAGDEPIEIRKLTPEEKQRGLEAMDRAQELSKQILEERGGKLFPPSWITINEQRDERTRQLT